jgi:hypothetical protein
MNTESIVAFLSDADWKAIFEYWVAFLAAMGIVAFFAHFALARLLDLQRKKLRLDLCVVLARYTEFQEDRDRIKTELDKYESLVDDGGYESNRLIRQSDIELERLELYKQLWNLVSTNPDPNDCEYHYGEAVEELSAEARRYREEAEEVAKTEL